MKLTSISLLMMLAVHFKVHGQCCDESTTLQIGGDEKDTFHLQVLNEADVLWSKRVWRIVEMRESSNRMLLNPRIKNEINLMNFLANSIYASFMKAYIHDDFKQRMNTNQVRMALTKYDSSNVGGVLEVDSALRNMNTICRFLIKEDYYFNKRNSTFNVKILGLAPLVDVYDSTGVYLGERELYWIYYPAVKCCFNKHKVRLNNDSVVTLESFISKNMFTSKIYYVSYEQSSLPINMQGTRRMDVELQRNRIRNNEEDFWEH